jgi:predicted hydrocarbon binding protein/KaiC/GvpD/RAD55 family RecA-like ATPase
MILLVGPPGSGKSTFCHQVILRNIETRPIIYVTTEAAPSKVLDSLRQRGLGEVLPHSLSFVDAFHETVGLSTSARPDTVDASSADLTSLGIAISKLRERLDENVLLVFDSLTTSYLMSGPEVIRFMRMTLLRSAAEGNAVLASVDEGCGKEEDLTAMMSTADGIIKMLTEEDRRFLNVVKHPNLRPTRIEVPIEPERIGLEARIFDLSALREILKVMVLGGEATLRREVGDFVNLFWPNLAHWSGMLWDPKRFPMMTYELNKEDPTSLFKLSKEDEAFRRAFLTRRIRLLMKLFVPKNFSKVKDMKKLWKTLGKRLATERTGIVEYLQAASKTDEHYFRVYESSDCWGFEKVRTAMASYFPPLVAGFCKGFEYWKGLERDWNAVETRCIGLGDPYCEFKLVPGEIDELRDSLEKDILVIEEIHERLMQRLMGFMLHGKPLVERPRSGSEIYIHPVFHAMAFPALAGERYRMALRMGGARVGKEVGERLTDAGLGEDEAVKRILSLLEHCKVGKVTMDESIKIRENCESSHTKLFARKMREPSCFFTTGFLNGFFSAVKNQHVKETKCIAMGDPYCEWEFR